MRNGEDGGMVSEIAQGQVHVDTVFPIVAVFGEEGGKLGLRVVVSPS